MYAIRSYYGGRQVDHGVGRHDVVARRRHVEDHGQVPLGSQPVDAAVVVDHGHARLV